FYTPSTGIWQTVWLEPVPKTHITSMKIIPDLRRGQVRVLVQGPGIDADTPVRVEWAREGRSSFRDQPLRDHIDLDIVDPVVWSPESPQLYELKASISNESNDTVQSYFAFRRIEVGKDSAGTTRILLNGKPYFQVGPLDQGFWPDGIYTAPTDEALKYDIEITKKLGFNMVRKHIKVEPQRWYYWADKLGILVWQDMPSCNSYTDNPSPPRVDPLDFIAELTAMVTNHWNSPAIMMWVAFNEGQGQQGSGNGIGQTNTAYLVSLVKTLDPSRLVNQASGWNYFGVGDVLDAHNYPDPVCPASTVQAMACGEFGGVWLGVTGHTLSPNSGDVSPAQASTSVTFQFETLANELPNLVQNQGMSAAVYTEISDVEIEL